MDTISVSASGILTWNGKEFKCALGKGGVSQNKIEGDGATPLGCFLLREVLYRADKIEAPITTLPVSTIQKNDGWCDDVNDPQYNKKVALPYPASHEELWREDDLYNIVVPLGYNDEPAVPGKGSAIFMHVARPNYTPTAGCIALSVSDLLAVLKEASADTQICIWAK
jgi:L,D-peptidoglycan transpeptidase YkuD (ErfK/YbiS/YcfS/YnhG family)